MIKEKFDKILDGGLDILFSKDKTKLYVLLVVIIGVILRIIAAINLPVFADDVSHALIGIDISKTEKMTVWSQSNALYYYLMDYSYKLFGVSQFSSRFPAIFFGSLSIILIYLLSKQFFKSKKIGLISAFLLAISPWHIKNTFAEMDVTVLFFIMLSALFLLKAIESSDKTKKNMFISGIAMGIAALIKLYALFFAFSFSLFFIYVNRKEIKKCLIPLGIFILTCFLLLTPSIISNYLLYQDKGFVDIIPTNILGIGKDKAAEYFSWDASWNKSPDYIGFFTITKHLNAGIPGWWLTLRYLMYGDIIIFIAGILGCFIAFKRKEKYLSFLILSFIPIWFYISSEIPLSKHLLFELILLIPLAAVFIDFLSNKLKNKGINLKLILVIILIFQLIWLGVNNSAAAGNFYSKSSIEQTMEYKNNIPQNALVVFDGRIYRGRANWMLYGTNYLESSLLVQAINESSKNGNLIPTEIYFIECVKDDCGWGTIKDQPEFNNSMEDIAEWFKNNSEIKKEIYEVKDSTFNFPFGATKEIEYKIYKSNLMLSPQIFDITEKTYSWWLYPIGWNENIEPIFDKYKTHNNFDNAIDKFAHWIFNISIILCLISILMTMYLFIIEENETINFNTSI